MTIHWNPITGRYGDELFSDLRKRVSRIIGPRSRRGRRKPWIGITSNPEERARWYSAKNYDEMFLLYKTRSENFVRDAEWDLLDHFKRRAKRVNGGPGGPLGEPPHYLYIVRRKQRDD